MKRGIDKEIPLIQLDDGWIGREARDDGVNRRHGWLRHLYAFAFAQLLVVKLS